MAAVIEDALRLCLAQGGPKERETVRLTTVGGKGLRPGVDLDDMSSVLEAMERKR